MLESRCHGLLTIVIARASGTDPAGRGAPARAAGAGSRRTASKSSRPADAWDGSNVVVAIAANSYPSSTLSNLDESGKSHYWRYLSRDSLARPRAMVLSRSTTHDAAP